MNVLFKMMVILIQIEKEEMLIMIDGLILFEL